MNSGHIGFPQGRGTAKHLSEKLLSLMSNLRGSEACRPAIIFSEPLALAVPIQAELDAMTLCPHISRKVERLDRNESGQGTGQLGVYFPDPFTSLQRPDMHPDAIQAALGITFTFVWLLVGQILVASR